MHGVWCVHEELETLYKTISHHGSHIYNKSMRSTIKEPIKPIIPTPIKPPVGH